MKIGFNGPSLTEDSEELAGEYERISAQRQLRAGKRLAADLAIEPGERVLDVGCGTGLLAEYIALLAGRSGYVLGIDPLPLRIEIAQQKARPGLEFRVGRAEQLDVVPDNSFDAVCLNSVFHWLPEKTGPLRQFFRILRPGGRLGIATGLKGNRAPVRQIADWVLAQPPFADYPRASGGDTYRVSEAEMRGLLEDAGFVLTRLETRASARVETSPEAMLRFSEASTFGNLLGHLPEELRLRARAAIKQRLEQMVPPDGYRREGRNLVALAVRP